VVKYCSGNSTVQERGSLEKGNEQNLIAKERGRGESNPRFLVFLEFLYIGRGGLKEEEKINTHDKQNLAKRKRMGGSHFDKMLDHPKLKSQRDSIGSKCSARSPGKRYVIEEKRRQREGDRDILRLGCLELRKTGERLRWEGSKTGRKENRKIERYIQGGNKIRGAHKLRGMVIDSRGP